MHGLARVVSKGRKMIIYCNPTGPVGKKKKPKRHFKSTGFKYCCREEQIRRKLRNTRTPKERAELKAELDTIIKSSPVKTFTKEEIAEYERNLLCASVAAEPLSPLTNAQDVAD